MPQGPGTHNINKIVNKLTEEKRIIRLPAVGGVLRGSADRESADRESADVS